MCYNVYMHDFKQGAGLNESLRPLSIKRFAPIFRGLAPSSVTPGSNNDHFQFEQSLNRHEQTRTDITSRLRLARSSETSLLASN